MFSRPISVISALFVLLLIVATAFAFTAEQAGRGKELYGTYCAGCHGADAGGGTVPDRFGRLAGRKAPPLAGSGALRGRDNAAEVYEYASRRMPANNPGGLQDDQYLDIVAFALQANGLQPDNQALTPESAKNIKLGGK